MQTIVIRTRVVLIAGPTSQGKTTLSKRIDAEFPGKSVVISHDEIVKSINPKLPKAAIDEEFREKFIAYVAVASMDPSIELIILDTKNIRKSALNAFLFMIQYFGNISFNDITLLKFNIPLKDNLVLARRHYPKVRDVQSKVIMQRKEYASDSGSLYSCFLDNEIIVTDTDIEISFD